VDDEHVHLPLLDCVPTSVPARTTVLRTRDAMVNVLDRLPMSVAAVLAKVAELSVESLVSR
jgi:hypothetical protein